MEDAMIISKGSLDRGFAHGQIYKTEVRNKIDKYCKQVELDDKKPVNL